MSCLEPETSVYKLLFQLDDSRSLFRKWLEITISIHLKLVVSGSRCFSEKFPRFINLACLTASIDFLYSLQIPNFAKLQNHKKNWVKILHIFHQADSLKKGQGPGGRIPNMILPFSVTSLWFTQSYTMRKRYSSYKPPPKIHGCRLVTVSRLHMLRQEETKRCIKHP